jgi:hypothetical protein
MKNLTILAYALMIIGGAMTISTSIAVLFSGTEIAYYGRFFPVFSGSGSPLVTFALLLVSGLIGLYLGQRFVRDPKAETRSALACAAISILGIYTLLASGAYIYIGLFFSGPPVSFVGGVAGALFNRVEIPAN